MIGKAKGQKFCPLARLHGASSTEGEAASAKLAASGFDSRLAPLYPTYVTHR